MNYNVRYLASGKLGDFIHQLSVINETFLETGQKGILYMTDKPEGFSFGLEGTFNDIQSFIKSIGSCVWIP